MNYTLEHIVRKPKIATQNPSLLLMLHGYGSNEQDLFSFANELPDELLIISARAPMSMGFGAYAWYTIRLGTDDTKFSDIPEAIQAREMISQFIDELQETYNFNPRKSFLMGFSQGTILSYAVALSYPEKVKNIIAMSGYVNEELLIRSKNNDCLKKLNFFCSHGTEDTVIPVAWARKTANYLSKIEMQHVYNEYYAGHGVAPDNFTAIQSWMREILVN